jgi:hypothetical protein
VRASVRRIEIEAHGAFQYVKAWLSICLTGDPRWV